MSRVSASIYYSPILRAPRVTCPNCGASLDPYAPGAEHETVNVTALGDDRESFVVAVCRSVFETR